MRPRRAARRRWWGAALLFLLATGTILGLLLVTHLADWAQSFLEQQVARRLDGELSFASFGVSLRRLELSFEGARLHVPREDGGGLRVEVEAGRVRILPASLLGIAAGRIRLAEVELSGPVVGWDRPLGPREAAPAPERLRPFDLRIDRLVIRDGRLAYADRTIPLSLDAEQVELRAAWEPRSGSLAGQAALGLRLVRHPFVQPLPLRIETGFRLRRHDLEIRGLSAEGGGLRGSLDGVARFERRTSFIGRGRAQVELKRLRTLLAANLPPMDGRLDGTFSVESGDGPLSVRGEVAGEALALGPLSAERGEAQARFTAGVLELDDLRARAYGGELKGEVDVTWSEGNEFRAELEGVDLELAALLEAVHLPLAAASRVDLALVIAGDPARPESWNGKGDFVGRASRGEREWVPLGGRGDFALADGRLELQADFALAAARFAGRLETDLGQAGTARFDFDGNTPNARDTQLAVLRILDGFELEAPELATHRLGGAGGVRGSIVTGEEPGLSLGLDLSAGRYGRRRFDRAELELAWREEELRISHFAFAEGEERAAGSARIRIEPMAVQELEMTLDRLDARRVLEVVGWPVELTGRMSGAMTVRVGAEGRQGGGELEVAGGTLYGESFDRLSGHLRVDPTTVRLDRLRVEGESATGRADFTWWTGEGRWDLSVSEGRVTPARLKAVGGGELPLQGTVELQGAVEGDATGLRGEFDLRGRDWGYGGRRIGEARGTARLDGEALAATIEGVGAAWQAEVNVGWGGEFPLAVRVAMDEALVEFGAEERPPVWATVTGEVEVDGSLQEAETMAAHARIGRAEIHSGVEAVEIAEPVELWLEAGRLWSSAVRLVGTGTELRWAGSYDLADDRLEASAKGTLALGLLTAVLPEVRARGEVTVDVEARGALAAPELAGTLACREGRVRWLAFPQSIDGLVFDLRLDGSEASLEGLRGRFGNGEIRGRGRARLRGLGLDSYAVDLEAANVRVAYPEGFRGIYDGSLRVAGDARETTIGGRLAMLLGEYHENFDLGGAAGRAYAGPEDSELPDRVRLDVAVAADGNVWVRNDLARLESSVDLHVGGSMRRPEVTGRIWMREGGELVYRDVSYRVTSGSIDFVDRDRLNPYLTMRAETKVGVYAVYLRVEGTLDRFEYELTSDPALSTPDIIALLSTGARRDEPTETAAEPSFADDLAASYFAGFLTGRVEKQLERLLGLERVRIDPLLTEGESDPTTRLTVGEEVAEDLYVIFSSEWGGTERQLYEVEWRATPMVRLAVRRDTQGGVGGDVNYTRRFWWGVGKPAETPEPTTPEGEPVGGAGGPRVAGVRIEGADADDEPALHRAVGLELGDPYSRSEIFRGVEAIKRYYVRRDRIETDVDAVGVEGPGGVEVVYRIDPGAPTTLVFEGTSKKERKQLRALLEELWIHSVFEEEIYDDAEDRILDYFRGRGHYAADVRRELSGEGERRRLLFRVDRGSPVRVSRVTIRGAEQLAEERIRSQMLTRPSSLLARRVLVPSVLSEDLSAIRSLYRSEGFLRVRVEEPTVLLSLDGESAEIEIDLEEGPRFTVTEVVYPEGLPFAVEELTAWAEFEPERVFSPGGLLEAEHRLRSAIDGRGYPEARVRGYFETEAAGVRVRFEVEPGEEKRVGEVRVSGNRLTRSKVVRRELDLAPGEVISRGKLLQGQHRLYRLGIFRHVRLSYEPLDPLDPTVQRLDVVVQESAPLSSSVGVGYDNEAKARLAFSLRHDNLGGFDRVLSFQGKVSSLERRVQLVGREPRLFGRKLSGLASVGWEEEEEVDFTVERTTTAVRIGKRLAPNWIGFLRYSLQQVDLSEVDISPEELEEEKLVEGRLGDLGAGFVRDRRDNPFMARHGTYAGVGLRLFARPFASEFSFAKSNLSWSFVRSWQNGQALATSVRLGVAVPFGEEGTVPISEAFFAGGDSTLRGFPRDGVGPASGGESMLLLNQEYRFPLWRSLKGVLFYDTGNVWLEAGDLDPTDLRHVLGTGVRLETPIGPIRLEYGHKLDREAGESSGEYFLAIGSAF